MPLLILFTETLCVSCSIHIP